MHVFDPRAHQRTLGQSEAAQLIGDRVRTESEPGSAEPYADVVATHHRWGLPQHAVTPRVVVLRHLRHVTATAAWHREGEYVLAVCAPRACSPQSLVAAFDCIDGFRESPDIAAGVAGESGGHRKAVDV